MISQKTNTSSRLPVSTKPAMAPMKNSTSDVIAAQLGFAVHVIDRKNHRQAADDGGHCRQEDTQAVGHEGEVPKDPADPKERGRCRIFIEDQSHGCQSGCC